MVDLSYPIAFSAGVVYFFAPCVLPLLPAYISYITGVSLKELDEKGYDPFKREVIISSTLYVLGFSLVFIILGVTAASFGILLRQNSRLIQQIGGRLIIIYLLLVLDKSKVLTTLYCLLTTIVASGLTAISMLALELFITSNIKLPEGLTLNTNLLSPPADVEHM